MPRWPKKVPPKEHWKCFSFGGHEFLFRGPSGDFQARLFQGFVDRELGYGFQALEFPVMKNHLQRKWVVSAPARVGELGNEGKHRHYLVISAPERAKTVLEFYKVVPDGLIHALGEALTRVKEKKNEESSREVQELPNQEGERLQG